MSKCDFTTQFEQTVPMGGQEEIKKGLYHHDGKLRLRLATWIFLLRYNFNNVFWPIIARLSNWLVALFRSSFLLLKDARGDIQISRHAQIGSRFSIGHNVTVGAASVVTRSVPDNCTVAGNPARVLNMNQPGRYVNRRWPIAGHSSAPLGEGVA